MRSIVRRTRSVIRRTSESDRNRPPRGARPHRTRHYTEPASRPVDSDSSDGDGGGGRERFNFDLSVAAQHSYLGIAGEVNNRKVYYPENSLLTIPLLDGNGSDRTPFDIILPGQDIPINAVTIEMRQLLETVLKSESKLMGYFIRVTHLKSDMSPLERNETNNEIEIGCTLRVRHAATHQSPNIISGTAPSGCPF